MTNRPVVGMAWMAATGILFVAFVACVKATGPGVPAQQGAFLRFAFGLLFLLPVLFRRRAWQPGPGDTRLFLLRGLTHALAVVAWFFAMARIPIAEVTAMNYMTPIYVTAGAALFLGERLAARRLVAIAVAVIGTLIILRPGFRELGSGHAAMVVTSLALGASYLIAKALSGRQDPAVIVAWMSLIVCMLLVPLAALVWVPLSGVQFVLLGLSAVFATAGHYAMTRAFQAAPVAVTQPVVFLQLVWASLLGAWVFGEATDPWVILGGGVIVAAVSFIAWRERTAASGSGAAT